jgi:hypothetical protein
MDPLNQHLKTHKELGEKLAALRAGLSAISHKCGALAAGPHGPTIGEALEHRAFNRAHSLRL